MKRVLVLYYSRTGNTQKMAEAVAEGSRSVPHVEVETKYYVKPEELADFDALAVGVPTYHHDITIDMKKLFEEAAAREVQLASKLGAAFGSYGWSGEGPRLVLEIMEKRFGMTIVGTPLLIKYTPDEAGLKQCRQLGKTIAEKLMA